MELIGQDGMNAASARSLPVVAKNATDAVPLQSDNEQFKVGPASRAGLVVPLGSRHLPFCVVVPVGLEKPRVQTREAAHVARMSAGPRTLSGSAARPRPRIVCVHRRPVAPPSAEFAGSPARAPALSAPRRSDRRRRSPPRSRSPRSDTGEHQLRLAAGSVRLLDRGAGHGGRPAAARATWTG